MATKPRRPRSRERVVRVRLTGRASRFVAMMQDLGHLDEDAVTDALMSLQATGPAGATVSPRVHVDLPTVRAAVAYLMFEDAEGGAIDGPAAEDWPLVFS